MKPKRGEAKPAGATTPEDEPGKLGEGEATIALKRGAGRIERQRCRVKWERPGVLLVDGQPYMFEPVTARQADLCFQTLLGVHCVSFNKLSERVEIPKSGDVIVHECVEMLVDGECVAEWKASMEGECRNAYCDHQSMMALCTTLVVIGETARELPDQKRDRVGYPFLAFALFAERAETIPARKHERPGRALLTGLKPELPRPHATADPADPVGKWKPPLDLTPADPVGDYKPLFDTDPEHKSYAPVFLSAFRPMTGAEIAALTPAEHHTKLAVAREEKATAETQLATAKQEAENQKEQARQAQERSGRPVTRADCCTTLSVGVRQLLKICKRAGLPVPVTQGQLDVLVTKHLRRKKTIAEASAKRNKDRSQERRSGRDSPVKKDSEENY